MVLSGMLWTHVPVKMSLTKTQVCERQMRDENGFKMHTQSETHVRQMLLVGEDPRKYINDYSNQFQRDFLQLLRTSHGEKKVHLNHFYQEYIHNKEHVHMNATKWPSLTEFAKFLGREGICRVEDDEKGLHIAWINNSPENLRRQDAIRRKERQDKGDETREQMLIREQVRKAQLDREAKGMADDEEVEGKLERDEGEKVKLNFAPKLHPGKTALASGVSLKSEDSQDAAMSVKLARPGSPIGEAAPTAETSLTTEAEQAAPAAAQGKVSLKMNGTSKPKNIFAAARKNALGGKKAVAIEQPKKMSEAERIMKEELEKRKNRGPPMGFGGPAQKRQKF